MWGCLVVSFSNAHRGCQNPGQQGHPCSGQGSLAPTVPKGSFPAPLQLVNREEDFLSWPLLLHLLMATSWADVSRSRFQLLAPSTGASSALQTWEGSLQCGTGTLSLPTLPRSVGLSCCPAAGQGDNARHGEQCLAFLFMHTHKRVVFSGSSWLLLCWVFRSGNNSWKFSVPSHSGDEFLNPSMLGCVALGWVYCFLWPPVRAQLSLPQSASSSIYP